MKIAVSGKGGVGKTTLSALLAGTLSHEGRTVIAIDADPDANLASSLGVPESQQPLPLSEMEDLIAQRTGSKDAYGGYFKLNPKVDDIPETYARRIGNIQLLVLGGVSKGGAGCICPATALLKALLVHLVMGRKDALVMDMEAGIEHLGRATAQSMDALIVVVDEGPWSIQTAHRVRKLADNIHLRRVFAVANRITHLQNVERIRRDLADIPLIGQLPYDESFARGILRLNPDGQAAEGEALCNHLESVQRILANLQDRLV